MGAVRKGAMSKEVLVSGSKTKAHLRSGTINA